MKKVIILAYLIVNILFLSSCSPDKSVVISKDYMTITYNSHIYRLTQYDVTKPDDCDVVNATVEDEDSLYYMIPLFYDNVYISPSENNYLWLSTTTDCTDNVSFEEIANSKNILTYELDEQ